MRDGRFAGLFERFPAAEMRSDSRDLAGFMSQNPRQLASFIGACMLRRACGETDDDASVASDEALAASDDEV